MNKNLFDYTYMSLNIYVRFYGGGEWGIDAPLLGIFFALALSS